ncbi:MAG: T9SS type A sorting domain-containing protein, partial [Saprospiraceae bacterium]|nr:T9SS type A sorting domain-containing protein [Saprospiraceae bacterium]
THQNLADIYFDYNFPIRTNVAQTKVAIPVFTKDITTDVHIYPNPVKDILNLDTHEQWTKAEIYDISGRIIRSVSLDGSSIDVAGLESGTYFMRVKNGEKVGLLKFVKM